MTGSSMGIMEGGGGGKFLAEWIVGGEPPMDPLGIDPRRFGAYANRDYRVAKAIECFANQFAIHFPYEERPAGRNKIKSPIHGELARAGARFGAVYGQERPNWFARKTDAAPAPDTFRRPGWFDAVAAECGTVATRAGLADMSVFSKFEVKGAGALDFMATLGCNHPPRRDGRIDLTLALTPSGGVISEFTVTRLSSDHFYLTSAAAARRQDHDLLAAHARDHAGVEVSDVSAARAVLALMGPRALNILSRLTDAEVGVKAFP
jgi:dimethylglycine dehydrogenase